MDYIGWLSKWFAENRGLTEEEIVQHCEDNFFEMDYIDSFSFIMLIGAIEEEFGITFDNESFQNREFSTVKGLAHAIEMEMSK